MTTLRKVELESVFLISLVAIVSVFFVVQRNNQGQFNGSISSPLAKPAPEQNIFTQISPDGAKEVIMKVTNNQDDTQTYSFYTQDSSDNYEQRVFSKTLDMTRSMSVPFNTWSSDNQYFFVQEDGPAGKSILAFKESGEAFSETEKYFDVTDLFEKKDTGNNFDVATGWASESLIIINTTKEDGTKGPSYWFEVPSKAIIQLSTEF